MRFFMTALIVFVALAGCSRRDEPPATPAVNPQTPTNRSFSNSYDRPLGPLYSQPGVNGGKPVSLPPIASQAQFSQNTPLAARVVAALQAQKGIDTRYIAVSSKDQIVKLDGSVSSEAQKSAALKTAAAQPGVKSIENDLSVKS
jgi:hypothetical protein